MPFICFIIGLIVLADGAEVLAEPYARLRQEIHKTNILSGQCKTARIIPVWKKEINLIFQITDPYTIYVQHPKSVKKIIQEHVVNESIRTGKEQHRFKKSRSTANALLQIQSKLATAMDNFEYIAMASLDLSTAFDVVNEVLLMTRLLLSGFSCDFHAQLNFWLTTNHFLLEQMTKNFGSSFQGTIQGSILGPMLFGLFISPLYKIVDIIDTCG